MPSVSQMNQLPPADALNCFLRCCGSVNWAKQMVARRPFANISDLMQEAGQVWRELGPSDWKQAFAKHPSIGGQTDSQWSKDEQAGVAGLADFAISEMSELNEKYFQKFGFVFLICATGKTGEEVLVELKKRIKNTPEQEIAAASREQQKIMRLRLEKLCKEK